MLGLILLYFIGKHFYTLADDYEKGTWKFAILGIVCYYVGSFLGGIIIFIAGIEIAETDSFADRMVWSIISLPFGLGACTGMYHILKNKWKKEEAEQVKY